MTEDEEREVLAAAKRLRDYTERYRAACSRRETLGAEFDAVTKECSDLFGQISGAQQALLETARPGILPVRGFVGS